MHQRGRDNLSIMAGFVLSAGLHVLVLTPWFMTVVSSNPAAHAELKTTPPADPLRPDITLGLEHESPSTLTWVGYEEHREHLAKLSEIEQADMTELPPSGAVAAAEHAPAEFSPLREEVTAPIVDELETSAAADSVVRPVDVPVEMLALNTQRTVFLPPPRQSDSAEDRSLVAAAESRESDGTAAEAKQAQAQRNQQGDPAADVPPPDPTRTEVTAPPQQETAEGEDVPPDETTGDVTDREADPAATVEVPPEQWKTGKPLAAQGMELRPRRRPEFTRLTEALPLGVRNPLAAMYFDHRGVVIRAQLVESSGRADVDKATIDWLYAWRASGKPIEKLEESDDPVMIHMRIILVERR